MNNLLQQVDLSKEEIKKFTSTESNAAEAFRIRFLGSKGQIKSLMAEMKNVPMESRKEMGQVLNELKLMAEKKYEELKNAVSNIPEKVSENAVDLTLPGEALPLGSRHPISIVRNKIISIFQRIGFALLKDLRSKMTGTISLR